MLGICTDIWVTASLFKTWVRPVRAGMSASFKSEVTRSSTGKGRGFPAPLPGIEALTTRNEARLIWWAIRFSFQGGSGVWLAVFAIATAVFGVWKVYPLGAGAAVVSVAVVLGSFLVGATVLVTVVQLLADVRRRRRGWLVGYFTAASPSRPHRIMDSQ